MLRRLPRFLDDNELIREFCVDDLHTFLKSFMIQQKVLQSLMDKGTC